MIDWKDNPLRLICGYSLVVGALVSVPAFGQESMHRRQPHSERAVYQPPSILDVREGGDGGQPQPAAVLVEAVPKATLSVGGSPTTNPPTARKTRSNAGTQSVQGTASQPPVGHAVSHASRGLVPTVVQVAGYTLTQDSDIESVPAESGKILHPSPTPLLESDDSEVIYSDDGSIPMSGGNFYPAPYGEVGETYCDSACDAMPFDQGCDSPGDWLLGPTLSGGHCGGAGCGGCGQCSGGFIPVPDFHNRCWFGGAEWLNFTRRGQDFPVLAANVTTPATPIALFGGRGTSGEDAESGFRVRLGRWLDSRQMHSVEARFWALDDESYGFFADQTANFPVGIPFNGNTFFQAVNNPGQANEFLNVDFESKVYGGDLTLRQLMHRGLGGRMDFVYGYQYFRLDEMLIIGLETNNAGPPASIRRAQDQFDVENDFHAARLGFSLRYDEGPWAFDGLFAMGFGAVRRTADLSFVASNQIPPTDPVADTSGASLVQASNAGKTDTSTFAVSPEVDLRLSYRLNSNLDFSVGYTYLMVSDVLQVYQTIDTTVDLTGGTRPVRSFSSGDYWVQGLSLGAAWNY
jgi:hypothetical protein